MAEYKSQQVALRGSAQCVYSKLSNLEALRSLLDKVPTEQIPDEQRQMFDNITITPDSLSIPSAGPIGNITLRKDGCIDPSLVRLVGVGTPVPIALMLSIEPVDDSQANGQIIVEIEVPMILKPMIAGPINKLVTQIANFLPTLNFAE